MHLIIDLIGAATRKTFGRNRKKEAEKQLEVQEEKNNLRGNFNWLSMCCFQFHGVKDMPLL